MFLEVFVINLPLSSCDNFGAMLANIFLISTSVKDEFPCNDSADRCCPPPLSRVGVVVLYSYRDDYYKILV